MTLGRYLTIDSETRKTGNYRGLDQEQARTSQHGEGEVQEIICPLSSSITQFIRGEP